ncbi:MAG: Gfo/Idh/MocA family oxidoreductase [Chloroflexi bacterium]|nr:Gfo/Idh/MocA family oxidoreductase [Chloroflexota bacterium]
MAVIGVGNIGYHHARNYSEIPDATLIAVADLDAKRGQAAAERFGCQFYERYEEMLEHERIEAVSIALPTGLHYRVALDVIGAGVATLVERPIASTVEEARTLVAVSREMNTVLAVGHIERFNPAVRELKRRIDAGELGDVTSVVAKRVGMLPPQVKDANVIVDLGVHDIDIINYLLGKLPTAVSATGGRALLSDRFDHAELFLKYDNIGCYIQVNWITPLKIRTLSVTGARGYAELNYITQKLDIYQTNLERHFDDFGDFVLRFGNPQTIAVPLVQEEPLRLELQSFLQTVQGLDSAVVTGEEGVEALIVAEWAMRQMGVVSASA